MKDLKKTNDFVGPKRHFSFLNKLSTSEIAYSYWSDSM